MARCACLEVDMRNDHSERSPRSVVGFVLPDAGSQVTTSSRKELACGAWSHRDYRILMALKHQLSMPSRRIPELDASILRTAKHPLSIRRERNTKHKVLSHPPG